VYFVYDLHIDISLFIHQHAGRSCVYKHKRAAKSKNRKTYNML